MIIEKLQANTSQISAAVSADSSVVVPVEDPQFLVFELQDAFDSNNNPVQIKVQTGQHTRSHIVSHIADLQTELQYWQDFLAQADSL